MDFILLFFALFLFRSVFTDPATPFYRLRIFSELPNVVALFEELGCVFSSPLYKILCSAFSSYDQGYQISSRYSSA